MGNAGFFHLDIGYILQNNDCDVIQEHLERLAQAREVAEQFCRSLARKKTKRMPAVGDIMMVSDLLDLQALPQLRRRVEELEAEVTALREQLVQQTGVACRCAQCGKDTLYVDMMRTVDGMLLCQHCAYWD
jgi:tRNA/tmRNA/rRNA uracil-C5-methylase (TrmA/RlmC/RlmD family)